MVRRTEGDAPRHDVLHIDNTKNPHPQPAVNFTLRAMNAGTCCNDAACRAKDKSAKCQGAINNTMCVCSTSDYTGPLCTTLLGSCRSNADCGHGECRNDTVTGALRCQCDAGYKGGNCSTYVGACTTDENCRTADDGATCNLQVTPTVCRCTGSFWGTHCKNPMGPIIAGITVGIVALVVVVVIVLTLATRHLKAVKERRQAEFDQVDRVDDEISHAVGNAVRDQAHLQAFRNELQQAASLRQPQAAWVIRPDELELKNSIGTGAFSEVFRAIWNNSEVAVKRLNRVLSDQAAEYFQEEVKMMSKLRHPNVLQFLGANFSPPFVVTEYMVNGSVHHYMRHTDPARITWGTIHKFCLDAAKGLAYLHGFVPPIIHRDMKSANLLISRDWTVKVADFGLARASDHNMTMTAVGTPAWTAPEILHNQRYTEKADVYSLGITFWEIAMQKTPFSTTNAFLVASEVDRGGRPPIPRENPRGIPPKFWDLVQHCWRADPRARPTMKEVVKRLTKMKKSV